MSRNFYSEINLHITWHTKESAPLLVPQVETIVHHYLRGRCINTPGVFVHEVGGTETHMHLCVSISRRSRWGGHQANPASTPGLIPLTREAP